MEALKADGLEALVEASAEGFRGFKPALSWPSNVQARIALTREGLCAGKGALS